MTECVCLCVCSVHFDSPETTIRRIFIYSLFMKPFVFKPPPRCYVRKRLYGKYKGTENHNQNTDLTLNNAREKKKKHSTIRTRRRWRRWCVPYKFRINVKKYAHGNRAEFYLCYIILCFFLPLARMLGTVLSFDVLCGVCRKVGAAAKGNRTLNRETQSNTKKLCKI